MDDMPECEKLKAIQDKSQIIGEFLEWLGVEKRYFLAKESERTVNTSESLSGKSYQVTEITPIRDSREHLLAEFFNIDLTVVEQEKRALLKSLQSKT